MPVLAKGQESESRGETIDHIQSIEHLFPVEDDEVGADDDDLLSLLVDVD